jgi:hypothetical protein
MSPSCGFCGEEILPEQFAINMDPMVGGPLMHASCGARSEGGEVPSSVLSDLRGARGLLQPMQQPVPNPFTQMSPKEQTRWAMSYIHEHYGRLPPSLAAMEVEHHVRRAGRGLVPYDWNVDGL